MDDGHTISKDDAFHILQNSRRRALLRYMLEHADQDEFDMRVVTETLAAWEHDTTVDQLTSDERQRVYIALYQSHLPKLDEYSIIDYDQNRGTIRPKPLRAVFERYLEPSLHDDAEYLAVSDADETDHPGLADTVSALLKG